MKKIVLFLTLVLSLTASAQLPNGSVAPDFTLTDYNGTEHNLYEYLDAGKTVYVEIFAAHCPSCWSYHLTNRMKNMYNMYGPEGSDEIMVMALEHDQWNDSNAFVGNGPAWVTQGDWLTGTPFPIFDVEDPDRGVFTDYNVAFYPVIYKICPDKILERVNTSTPEDELYQQVQDCQAALSIDENLDLGNIYIDPQSKSLVVDQFQDIRSIQVINLQGQIVRSISSMSQSVINLGDLNTGIYVFELSTDRGSVVRKLFVE